MDAMRKSLAITIALLAAATPAHASGFLAATFGGEHGHPHD